MNRLPPEMLANIFSYLYGRDVLNCRDVCSEWRDAVDNLPDTAWREICLRENYYEDYIAAHKKYGLSWRHTHRALNSWEDIASADMTTRKLADIKMQHFKVLPNEVIACFQCNRIKNAFKGHSDTIVYYNLQTFQECGRDEFDFAFSSIHTVINDHFYVFLVDKKKVCIVLKENKKKIVVGKVSELDNFSVIDKEVYFRDASDEIIYISKLVKKNGVTKVKTRPLEAFSDNYDSFTECVLAYGKKGKDGDLYILTDEGKLYHYENDDFGWMGDNDGDFVELEECGFDWKSPPISEWVFEPRLRSYKLRQVFFAHARYGTGMIILTKDTSLSRVKIYNSKYITSDLWNFWNAVKDKPLRMVTVGRPIVQMDIVETASSHKILALCNEYLYICEFYYETGDKHGSDEEYVSEAEPEVKYQSGENKAKKFKQNVTYKIHPHRYSTRQKSKVGKLIPK